ncbi:DNA helicase-2/ATP-dependent DNA helicase PcrA [Frondihabitans sp. PhB188]|nr:DNA helicase-2/ATP-dependent DNA helicase PcrA [Frondihabitans sp. PhB188]
MAPRAALSALDIAEVLSLPAPTPEQQAVIEAPLEPALVVAGAGSGKTETMAGRVVWLLANGHVSVSEILGLTFTRKAAGELQKRIEKRIALLSERGLLGADRDPFDAPTVSTYNSFASTIFRDNALLVGRESESQVLSEASAWQIARALVVTSGDERLAFLDRSVDAITQAVIDLSHALAENVASSDDVRRMARQFERLIDLPATKASPYKSVVDAVADVGSLAPLLDLADAFAREKARRGLVEFSDQVALALAVCETAPRVVEELRTRFRVILLDEYQDTSVVQTRLLARLFARTGVMAVGDPHQSIYGFRGASAANLGRFPVDFGAGAGAHYTLSTSWRNAKVILDSANAVVHELAAGAGVGALTARPGAPDGRIDIAYEETLVDEAAAVADWFARELEARTAEGHLKTAALLFRSKKTVAVFADALRDRGVRYRILGVGGLLQRPEVVDLVSCLRVLGDPAAGSEMIRLLVGARWRVGLRDIAALRDVASWLFRHDHAQKLLDDDVATALRSSVAPGEQGSIVDAVDFVATAPATHRQLAGFTPAGVERIRTLGRHLAFLRNRIGLDLVDLVTLVQQEMLLDVEVAAAGGSLRGGAYLQAFDDEVAGYVATDESASLQGFLSWLSAAERRDDMGPRSDEGEDGVVQLLTIHGSKGLEWDLVGVPRLVADELPGASRAGRGWLNFGQLPYEFRGDSAELPALAWRGVDDQKQFDQGKQGFEAELRARHYDEERRLAYVAFTRAKEALLLSGSFWATQSKPRAPSRYLVDLVEAGVVLPDALPDAPRSDENPLSESSLTLSWPVDPLSTRRDAVEYAAALVRTTGAAGGARSADIDLLLAERDSSRDRALQVALPQRIPASRFKDYVDDAAAVARSLRRPLPERPYRATRLGTLFHAWVEDRYQPTGAGETLDAAAFDQEAAFALDYDADEAAPLGGGRSGPVDPDDARRLAELQATFEASEWADLDPVDVELEIHLPLGPRTVICKIDAVFVRDGRYQVVDWKTGKAPRDADDLRLKQLQLALYREAYASYRSIDPAIIDAVFYFVADDKVVRPENVSSRAELERLWAGVEGGLAG